MARCHLSRQLSILTGKLGNNSNNVGHFSLFKNCVAAGTCDKQSAKLVARKHTAASKLMLKPLPQLTLAKSIATSQPRAGAVTGDHVRLWQAERITSAALIGLLPACILLESPIVDSTLAVLMVMHSHWGLEAVVIDYARPIVVGNVFPKVAHLALNLFSAATLAGLILLIYNGPGLGRTVKNFWAIGKEDSRK